VSEQSTERRAHVWVTGRVQGVWFRASTAERAESLGIRGWVRNLADGRVELVAEGAQDDVDAIISFCHEGPSLARVDNVAVEWEPPAGEVGFEVRRYG